MVIFPLNVFELHFIFVIKLLAISLQLSAI